MCCCTASHGVRRSAPTSGRPNGSTCSVKAFDFLMSAIYCQITLPVHSRGEATMSTRMGEEIKVGPLAIRFVVEADETAGSVTLFEFDVPAGTTIAAAHSHDRYEETIYGLEGVLTWTVAGKPIEVGAGEALVIPRG